MRKTINILILCVMFLILTAAPLFSDVPQVNLKSLQKTVDDFSSSLSRSLPFNSTMGLNWSDAYIGQLIALPPHFGIGVSSGFTTMDFGSISNVLNMFDTKFPLDFDAGFPLPGYTVEARVGGFIIPFDIGVKFGKLNFNPDFLEGLGIGKPEALDFSMNYTLFGADFRYALLTGEKVPLRVSLGLGFNYLKGGISMPMPGGKTIEYKYKDLYGYDDVIRITKPDLDLKWDSKSIDFKAQASLRLLGITPFIGVGASHAWSSAGYEVKSKLTDGDGFPINIQEDTKKALEKYGINNVTKTGFQQINTETGWSLRTFGGLGLKMTVIRFDLTGMYDFTSGCFGVTVGTRFQL